MRMLSKRDHEDGIFSAFQNAAPNFAGEAASCSRGADPPDFLCEDSKGRRIGVELEEWLHESQTKRARVLEILEGKLVEVSLKQSFEKWLSQYNVLLYPVPIPSREECQDSLAREADWPKFTSDLFGLLGKFKNSGQPIDKKTYLNDFRETPKLGQLLIGIRIYPVRTTPRGIKFARGGWYFPEDAIHECERALKKKTTKHNYQNLKMQQRLDELYLVVYYNRALLWNSPYEGINGGIDLAVEKARKQMSLDHGPFDKVFLFLAFEPDMKVFTLWP